MTNEEFRRISYQWFVRRPVDARTRRGLAAEFEDFNHSALFDWNGHPFPVSALGGAIVVAAKCLYAVSP